MDELTIIEKLRNGQEEAFRELVDKYQKMVVTTCLGMVHHLEDAEDIAQEVFIEIFRSIHSFRADSRLSTWIYRIAVNKSLNYIRNNKRKKWIHSQETGFASANNSSEPAVTEGYWQPGFELENSQRAALLHEAIHALPENQKTAFVLNKYDDLSYQEISDVMELSISSIESLIHRAKKNLQKKLYQCYKKRCL